MPRRCHHSNTNGRSIPKSLSSFVLGRKKANMPEGSLDSASLGGPLPGCIRHFPLYNRSHSAKDVLP